MILGRVNDQLEIEAPVNVAKPDGTVTHPTAIVGTGYNGYLALPKALAVSIGLEPRAPRHIRLGDGSGVLSEFFAADVHWFGQLYHVNALATQDEILIGTALLESFRMEVMFHAGETVRMFAP